MTEKKPVIVVKYGGNAMTNEDLQRQVIQNICMLQQEGYRVVIVHGGGPFIKQALFEAKVESEFIDGHRVTTPEALLLVEKALKGQVNGALVKLVNQAGYRGVGLSGKDGKIAIAIKRIHRKEVNGLVEEHDLGRVGDVVEVNTGLLDVLLQNDYIPVLACLAADTDSNEFNVNGDMFAGHIAGALRAEALLILTDVDGLMMDKDDASSLISTLEMSEIEPLKDKQVIQGGMIPKTEACKVALEKGAQSAVIINGTQPEQILAFGKKESVGTVLLP
ncbi:acetylglutamate kinase [Balneolaceae bacterium ANBcel3]|nr:acetylglutamate kinase [Balneolaceae bacterium ANBcel3]